MLVNPIWAGMCNAAPLNITIGRPSLRGKKDYKKCTSCSGRLETNKVEKDPAMISDNLIETFSGIGAAAAAKREHHRVRGAVLTYHRAEN